MYKLLSADFRRLIKSRLFWILLLTMLFLSAGNMLNFCRRTAANETAGLEDAYFMPVLLLGIFCAVFSGLFFGTEYSDGSIRNKLSVGHTRRSVYLANLLLCFAATLSFALAALFGGLAGIPALGLWKLDISVLLLYLCLIILLSAAYSAIAAFISMLCSNKAAASVVSILFILVLFLASARLDARLQEPEFIQDIVVTAENGMQWGEPVPNPLYVSGSLRPVLQFLMLLLPTGQSHQIAYLNISQPVTALLCSVGIAVLVTAAGMLLFRKKDIR